MCLTDLTNSFSLEIMVNPRYDKLGISFLKSSCRSPMYSTSKVVLTSSKKLSTPSLVLEPMQTKRGKSSLVSDLLTLVLGFHFIKMWLLEPPNPKLLIPETTQRQFCNNLRLNSSPISPLSSWNGVSSVTTFILPSTIPGMSSLGAVKLMFGGIKPDSVAMMH